MARETTSGTVSPAAAGAGPDDGGAGRWPFAGRAPSPAVGRSVPAPRCCSRIRWTTFSARRWPWRTAISPIMRATVTWPPMRWRPFSASLGTRSRASSSSPRGAYTSRSRSCSPGSSRVLMDASLRPAGMFLNAVAAVLALGVGQLARVLDQETGLADELARPLGQDLGGALGPVLGVGDLVLLVLLLVDDDEAVLQDDVEPGLDVVGVDVVIVLIVVVVFGHHDHADRYLGLLVDVDI